MSKIWFCFLSWKRFDDEIQNITIEHTFTIYNQGPSPTKEDTTSIHLYIADSKFIPNNLVAIKLNGDEDSCKLNERNLDCTTTTTLGSQIFKHGNGSKFVSNWDDGKCMEYICSVNTVWEKGESKIVNVKFSFTKIQELQIASFAKIKASDYVHDGKGIYYLH